MTAYLQMGHDTENLIGEADLMEFGGLVLSPVNREPERLLVNMPIFRERGDYDIVLDPQLYYPRGMREKLVQQPYFPDSFNTTDFSTAEGWKDVIDRLATYANTLGVDAVASPVVFPRRWSDDFYDTSVETSRKLSRAVGGSMRVLTTCLVSLADLNESDRAMQIGSILSRYVTDGYYVVISSDVNPRLELSDAVGLANLLKLISLLSTSQPVLVAYSSSDMILFKAAGAKHCGTSKFFNLRRFTMSRFEEPSTAGGGQLPYWFSHNLLAFLREADIRRLERDGYSDLFGGLHSLSDSGQRIRNFFVSNPGEAWLGMSWRQYLSWFGKTEHDVKEGEVSLVRNWLRDAEQNWRTLEDDEVLMDEPRNDGAWIRPWRQALRDFTRNVSLHD